MPTPNITYPLDITGAALSNKVPLEQHIVTTNNYKDYFFVVPKFAPFFITNLAITHSVNGVTRPLIEGVDFLPVLPFIGASRSIGVPLYGGVSFTNLSITGIVSFTYQTVGGDWLFDDQQVLTTIANLAYNPRITSWEQVTGLPNVFPVTNHDWNLVDLVGETELLNKLTDIEQAILQRAASISNNHLTDYNNPHRVTKEQVGLGLVENFGIATLQEALNGIKTDKIITPFLLSQVLRKFLLSLPNVVDLLNLHLTDYNNPHRVTKEQLGITGIISPSPPSPSPPSPSPPSPSPPSPETSYFIGGSQTYLGDLPQNSIISINDTIVNNFSVPLVGRIYLFTNTNGYIRSSETAVTIAANSSLSVTSSAVVIGPINSFVVVGISFLYDSGLGGNLSGNSINFKIIAVPAPSSDINLLGTPLGNIYSLGYIVSGSTQTITDLLFNTKIEPVTGALLNIVGTTSTDLIVETEPLKYVTVPRINPDNTPGLLGVSSTFTATGPSGATGSVQISFYAAGHMGSNRLGINAYFTIA